MFLHRSSPQVARIRGRKRCQRHIQRNRTRKRCAGEGLDESVPLEDAARKQLLNAAQLPFIFKWIAAMTFIGESAQPSEVCSRPKVRSSRPLSAWTSVAA